MDAMIRAAAALARAGQAVERGARAGTAAWGELLGAALSPAEREAVTLALYARAGGEQRDLFPWEIKWFDAWLPSGGRVLVAGAGAGAEVRALRARGLAVDAAEPVDRLAGRLAAAGAGQVVRADHGSLAAGILDGAGPAARLAGARYDAVLLGWGSLTHVLEAATRVRVLQAADRLTAGPILASFWMAETAGPPPRSVGARLGRALGRLRGHVAPTEDERFAPWCGFGHLFSAQEVEALGRALGREAVWGEGPYPHVAWVRG
ncbi:MAG: hypothetical protein R3F60_21780 [bacterium]